MRNKAVFMLLFALVMQGCSSPEITKYEKIYLESVAQKIAKAEGTETADAATAAQTPVVKADRGNTGKEDAVIMPSAVPAVTAGIQNRQLSSAVIAPTIMPTAVPTPAAGPKKKRFKIKELDISSDSLTFNKDTSVTVFIGNVVLLAEGVRLKCEKLTSKNYKDNAEATGNVRAFYKAQKTSIKCGRIKYGNQMSSVEAYDSVITEKYLDNGNTITLYADRADFETEYGAIAAKKVKKKVKVVYKDMVAFSDKVIYNDETGILEMTGKPVVKKSGSSFTSSRIKVDVNKKTMKMENDIWSRIFYGDMKKAETEVKVETNNNPAPR